jgi:hypothetical protein
MLLHNYGLCCSFRRQSKANITKMLVWQKRVALFSVTGQMGLPYGIILYQAYSYVEVVRSQSL